MIQIDSHENHFANRSNRVGWGLAIFSSTHLGATIISTHKTRTQLAASILFIYKQCKPLIHPPNCDQTTTLDYITNTILKLTPKYSNACSTYGICEQFGLKNLVDLPKPNILWIVKDFFK